jgi:hypothetical protein
MRSTYSIKLELLLDLRIRVEQVNLFELKFNLSITLVLLNVIKIAIIISLLKSNKLNISLFYIRDYYINLY